MFDHKVRLLSSAILLSSWLSPQVRAAAAPAQHAAGLQFTPVEDQMDHLAHFTQADSVEDAKSVMQDLHTSYAAAINDHLGDGCTEENMIVRKEWGDLTPDERRSYISACHCLHEAPSQTPNDIAPGAKNRWDDFVVAHVLNTDDVHRSPWLLPFHAEFLFQFEKALRDECGYTGGQPYWDHSRYIDQPIESWPMFDGSDTSLSGNGQPDTPDKDCYCVTEGPFANWKVNLGPAAGNSACTLNPQDDGLGFNERCLERKWDPDLLTNLTYDNIRHTVQNMQSPDDFGTYIETWPVGVHPLPHVFVGGTQVDVPASPSDVVFWSHHSGLDRLWQIWKYIDFDARVTQLAKAESFAGLRESAFAPPALAVYLDSEIKLSPIFETVKVRDVMNPTGGRYCYRYD